MAAIKKENKEIQRKISPLNAQSVSVCMCCPVSLYVSWQIKTDQSTMVRTTSALMKAATSCRESQPSLKHGMTLRGAQPKHKQTIQNNGVNST